MLEDIELKYMFVDSESKRNLPTHAFELQTRAANTLLASLGCLLPLGVAIGLLWSHFWHTKQLLKKKSLDKKKKKFRQNKFTSIFLSIKRFMNQASLNLEEIQRVSVLILWASGFCMLNVEAKYFLNWLLVCVYLIWIGSGGQSQVI